jgi:uncharacterized protein
MTVRMNYRGFGKITFESSALAFGTARLPGFQSPAGIDKKEAVKLIRFAIDHGVNYVDLGFPWNDRRNEAIVATVRTALADGYRDRVKVALTVPASSIGSPRDFDEYLTGQLKLLGRDEIDFLLLGRLMRDNWPRLRDLGAVPWIDKVIKDGRATHAGFTFHDHYQILKQIVQDYEGWSVVQVQYSFMDIDHDPGTSGIGYASDSGLAVVVAEPLKGGRLTKEPPERVRQVWTEAKRDWSLAEWGLRFVWNHPGVATVVCDMNNMEQLAENLEVAQTAVPDSLTVQEEVLLGRVRDAYRNARQVPCPSCRPCMPCRAGIDVPRFFEVYNDACMYGDIETARAICADEALHPEDCVECRECESRCAKRLPIVEWVKKGRDYLSV